MRAISAGAGKPVVEMLIPSTLDDTLGAKGQHVASLFCQHVAPQLPDGNPGDRHREEVADLMIATVDAYRAGICGERDRPAGSCRHSIWSASSGFWVGISSTAR